jgi:NAD(P)-dependent dehydrogenase (short-subunit alcohol dehydrogenase family)
VSVVIITGAGQGQGAAEAWLLAARGATVIAADLAEAPAEDLAGADYRQLDVTDQAGWADLARELAERHGRVHGLVANAGITWRARLLDVTPEDVRRVHEVNVTGALLAIQTIAPLMAAGESIAWSVRPPR